MSKRIRTRIPKTETITARKSKTQRDYPALRFMRFGLWDGSESGKTPQEVLKLVEEARKEDADTRRKCIEEMLRIRDGGDVEGARKYSIVISAALQQMGIKGISLPPADEERASDEDKNTL